MSETTTRRWTTVVMVINVLIVGEATTFLLATLLHLGIPVPLGFTQPQIIPAAIVEGLCGIFLAVSAYAIFTYKTWAWRVALAAHVFAVVGVLLGILATIRRRYRIPSREGRKRALLVQRWRGAPAVSSSVTA